MMLHTKYQGSRSYGFRNSDKKIFHVIPILYNNFLRKLCDPRVGALGDAT